MTTPAPDRATLLRREHTAATTGHQCAGVDGNSCNAMLFQPVSRCLRCERQHALEQARRAA